MRYAIFFLICLTTQLWASDLRQNEHTIPKTNAFLGGQVNHKLDILTHALLEQVQEGAFVTSYIYYSFTGQDLQIINTVFNKDFQLRPNDFFYIPIEINLTQQQSERLLERIKEIYQNFNIPLPDDLLRSIYYSKTYKEYLETDDAFSYFKIKDKNYKHMALHILFADHQYYSNLNFSLDDKYFMTSKKSNINNVISIYNNTEQNNSNANIDIEQNNNSNMPIENNFYTNHSADIATSNTYQLPATEKLFKKKQKNKLDVFIYIMIQLIKEGVIYEYEQFSFDEIDLEKLNTNLTSQQKIFPSNVFFIPSIIYCADKTTFINKYKSICEYYNFYTPKSLTWGSVYRNIAKRKYGKSINNGAYFIVDPSIYKNFAVHILADNDYFNGYGEGCFLKKRDAKNNSNQKRSNPTPDDKGTKKHKPNNPNQDKTN